MAESAPARYQVGEGRTDRFQVPTGFQVRRVAQPEQVGAVSPITWGNRGRLIAARENGPVLSLNDTGRDGSLDGAVEYSRTLTNCQGLCAVFNDLYAVGDGPSGTGMYRLPDRDHDDRTDEVQLIVKYENGGRRHFVRVLTCNFSIRVAGSRYRRVEKLQVKT